MRRKKSTIILLTYVGIIRIRLKGQDETRPISADCNLSAPLRSIFNNYYIRIWSFVKTICRKSVYLRGNTMRVLLKTLLKRLKVSHVLPKFDFCGQAMPFLAEGYRKCTFWQFGPVDAMVRLALGRFGSGRGRGWCFAWSGAGSFTRRGAGSFAWSGTRSFTWRRAWCSARISV